MLTQEFKQDIKNLLSNLTPDELQEVIRSLDVDSRVDSSELNIKQAKSSWMTWAKLDKFLILISGGIALGSILSGIQGAAIGTIAAIVYGCFILSDETT